MGQSFESISKNVLEVLNTKLPSYLTYHSIEHTKYVVKMAEYLAWRENIEEHDVFLNKIAALYHDIGFIESRDNHEETGCRIVTKELGDLNFAKEDIAKICGMIMATKIPQNPNI